MTSENIGLTAEVTRKKQHFERKETKYRDENGELIHIMDIIDEHGIHVFRTVLTKDTTTEIKLANNGMMGRKTVRDFNDHIIEEGPVDKDMNYHGTVFKKGVFGVKKVTYDHGNKKSLSVIPWTTGILLMGIITLTLAKCSNLTHVKSGSQQYNDLPIKNRLCKTR